MKITILSPSYPFRGGIANFTDLLYSELKKNRKAWLEYQEEISAWDTTLEDGLKDD